MTRAGTPEHRGACAFFCPLSKFRFLAGGLPFYFSGLFFPAKYASGVAKQCFETVVHVLLDVAVKQG
jgi:hypothetical protein